MKNLTLPAVVTLGRLLISPLLLPFFLVYLLPFDSLVVNSFLAALFVLLSLTDRLEDYFSQRVPYLVALSKQLDPIADKLLSSAALIALLAAHKIFFYWVIILIGRDFFVMGMRLIAHDHNFALPVSVLAKIKSAVQLAFIAYVIFNPYQARGLCCTWNVVQLGLLVATLVMSLFTAKLYFDQFKNRLGDVTPVQAQQNQIDDVVIEEAKPESSDHDNDRRP
jgi:CDP-diacylglycerol--glycerol-3-phosphate 3-phosphatidyltransferase